MNDLEQPRQDIKNARNKGNSIVAFFVIIALAAIGIYCFNYFQLQLKMNEVMRQDQRNNGVEVSVHFGNYLNPSVLVYDLRSVSVTNSKVDVFRVFLQFAEKVQSRNFEIVELSFRGKTKFKMQGNYFQTLGNEYSWQNPVYTMRTFPEHLIDPDGLSAYSVWTGGWLGVTTRQMEDFNDFHDRWWLNDML